MSASNSPADDKKVYLDGLAAGHSFFKIRKGEAQKSEGGSAPTGPDALLIEAQNKQMAEGKKLCPEETNKRKKHGLDTWDDIAQHAKEAKYPKGGDVLNFKYHGLFYVSPAQDSYMSRLRFPGGLVNSYQLRGLARLAEDFGGGYTDVTTRANLQIREIKAANAVNLLTGLYDLGIVVKGSGADNIRNVTGSPTAGIDPQELIDTRPLTREMHFYILNHREMYGLPRKFNIAFDGGGAIGALEDTNDIGFSAVRVGEGHSGVEPGIYFRVQLGGITGHKDFARDTGIMVKPEEAVAAAAAMVRVFILHGDRTDRKKARLKYLLDKWGLERFMDEAAKLLSFPWRRFPIEKCEVRPQVAKHGHVGFHRQSQKGFFWCGVVMPVGRMTATQMRGLADIADRHGSGTIRLTVWQNLLISDVSAVAVPHVKKALESIGLAWSATNIRGALVACTGNEGCKYAGSNTKKHALALADYLEKKIEMDLPLNIHLTGCPHSCAQHYIGDIGMQGTKIDVNGTMVEGYHVCVGGGYGSDQMIGRDIQRDVPFEEIPAKVEGLLRAYLEKRVSPKETFVQFTNRHSVEEIRAHFEPVAVQP